MASMPPPSGPNGPAGLHRDPGGLVARLMNFDVMIGGSLIKLIYYIGLVLIGLGAVIGVISGLGALTYSPLAGLVSLVALVLFSGFGVLVWRFTCELWILLFRIHDVLVDIRAKP